MIELKTKLQLADEDLNYGSLYYTVFPVPRSSVATLLEREHNATRVLVKVNGRGNLSAGLMPDGKGDFFITVSKEVRRKFDLEEGQAVVLQISPDDSEYGMPLPEEVAELWAMDEEAYTVFHTLTPGKQRGLLYVIGKPKRPETRVKKAVQIFEYLKSVGGKLDYRELNAYMKAENERW
ncbi:YdeI/OmpD-associated family protein [Neolewinella lacunae]|uniref:YdeI/OmpD-associated family protein n=1 Tax=Neolewinella lacunae TaxID=1517758 RepID=A0A923PPY3_9BACT|nr:YdeI/OmpD-associated family protein [Neolewinella lacunae]MBC6995314.1 YdeI/OmpD-associated family protein [Neolewinella lacunae]MDN3633026.1 YdeI/OmpD-associated family protein [Neolewinella lacunae]